MRRRITGENKRRFVSLEDHISAKTERSLLLLLGLSQHVASAAHT